MDIKEIVKVWLEENDYEGLVEPELECGCSLDDFMPCDYPNIPGCKPAFRWSDGLMREEKEEQVKDEVFMINFPGCKHLIFDRDRMDKRMKILALPGDCGAYWERDKPLLPDESCAVNVQFCDKLGRLNSKVACLKGMGECSLYEETIHSVVVDG